MADFCADENFPLPIAQELRRLGHSVVTLQDQGKANRSLGDKEVLDLAREQGRALFTHNRRHFIRLHAEQPSHSGIVVCSFDSDFTRQAQSIHAAANEAGILTGRLIRIHR